MQKYVTDNVYIYCDASFSRQHQIAVAGFLLLANGDNKIDENLSLHIETNIFKEKNNIRAELMGIIFVLQTLVNKFYDDNNDTHVNNKIIIYSDCQSIVSLNTRRSKLESTNFISKRSGKIVGNADLYKQFFTLSDKLDADLIWVKGHNPNKNRDTIQKNFSYVDRAVRKKLRHLIRHYPLKNDTK